MIKVQIVKDGVKGADDGATVRAYPKDGGPDGDGVYFVSTALAEVFIEAGEATEIEVKKRSVTDKVKARAKPTAAEKAAAEKEAAEKAAAEKEAADKAAAEKEAAEKAAAARSAPVGLPGLPKSSGK